MKRKDLRFADRLRHRLYMKTEKVRPKFWSPTTTKFRPLYGAVGQLRGIENDIGGNNA